MMLSLALLILSISYGLVVLVLHRQLQGLFAEIPVPLDHNPRVSVIIAVRDEAPHLTACLGSVAALDYPAEKLEIILVDDNSRDGSSQLLQDFCAEHPGIRLIRLDSSGKELPGKAGAVYAGLKESKGEFIFMTDADCRVPAGWIRHLLAAFTDEVGLVGGFTTLAPLQEEMGKSTRFAAVQALDWLFLLAIAAAAIRMGKPLSWMGNNMAFRRSAYDAVGGYPALGHSLIEDFALLNAISRKTPWKVRVTAAAGAFVVSSPVETIPALYHQRRRWALGIEQVRPSGKSLMVIGFLAHLGVAVSLFCCPLAGLSALLLLVTADYLICRRMARVTQTLPLLRHLAEFELFYFAYSLILPLLMLFDRRIRWKNQNFPVR
jgi:cellulose synthase/poly-beta-1,6-N-acetylglucosamine synthase-like glycosyltransferase